MHRITNLCMQVGFLFCILDSAFVLWIYKFVEYDKITINRILLL